MEHAMRNKKHHYSFIAASAFAISLSAMCGAAWPQAQDNSAQSVAEAARRAREQKKHDAKPVHTFTNEDLPPAPASSSGSMSTTAAPAMSEDAAVAVEKGEREAPATVPANEEQAKQKKAENLAALEREKEQLAVAEKKLDLMQRKFALDGDAFYSKADFASDKEGQAALDAEAQQINDKKNAVEALKARVAELQALVGEQESPQLEKKPDSPSEK